MARLALKIDVDTHRGLGQGVERLLDCLGRRGITASFYVSMGPDNSGKAIRRLFTRPGFAGKMLRSNALRLYGIRTALSGTLLRAPQIARSFPGVLRRIVAEGHELGVHGYDHVYWHDRLLTLEASQVGRSLRDIEEALLGSIRGDGPNVLTVHAEVEGGAYLDFFASLLQQLSGRVRFERLMDLVQSIERDALPVCPVVQARLPGRAGTVSCQAA